MLLTLSQGNNSEGLGAAGIQSPPAATCLCASAQDEGTHTCPLMPVGPKLVLMKATLWQCMEYFMVGWPCSGRT